MKVATSSLKFLVSCGFKTKKPPKAAFEPNVPKTWRLSNFQLVQHHTEEVPTGEITTKQLVMSCSIDCTGVWATEVIMKKFLKSVGQNLCESGSFDKRRSLMS